MRNFCYQNSPSSRRTHVVQFDVSLADGIVPGEPVVIEHVQMKRPVVQFLHCETCGQEKKTGVAFRHKNMYQSLLENVFFFFFCHIQDTVLLILECFKKHMYRICSCAFEQ